MIQTKTNIITAKYIDFGLSTVLQRKESSRESCGTLAYLSPEVTQGHPYTSQTDIWSLGVVLHCLLTRAFPFVTRHVQMTQRNIVSRELSF